MAELFYIDHEPRENFSLSEDEARHLVKVLRYREGDRIQFTDGKGSLFTAELISARYDDCRLSLRDTVRHSGQRAYSLHVAIAPTKNTDRFEWFLEKATEIGVSRITPMICQHSERRDLKTDRFQKILVSAMKQSYQTYLPLLNEPMEFRQVLDVKAEQRLIAHLDSEQPVSLRDACHPGGSVLILIGPEGDFSLEELQHAGQSGFRCVSMGPTRLRTETAGIMACSVISTLNN